MDDSLPSGYRANANSNHSTAFEVIVSTEVLMPFGTASFDGRVRP